MPEQLPPNVLRLLDPTMKSKIFEVVRVGEETYYFVDQYDEDGGEPVIIRQSEGEKPEIVEEFAPASDPSAGGASPALSPKLQERLRAMRGEEENDDAAAGGAGPLAQDQLNKKFSRQAEKCADPSDPDFLVSKNAPGTDGGNLACAWAVNQVSKKALGKQIGGGLSTANMAPILKDRHFEKSGPVRGCVIISPTVTRPNGTRNIGHVGIVGKVDGDNTLIYSNSSGAAEFQQNFTLKRWVTKYKTTKGLKVMFFELNPALFANAMV